MKNLFFILILFLTAACVPVTPVPTSKTQTPQPESSPPILRTMLDISRNGKIYSLQLGMVNGAQVEWQSDLDGDGEIEIIISTFAPGELCYQTAQVWDYLPGMDDFRPVAEISDHCAAFERFEDLGKDNTPELLARDSAFNFALGGSSNDIALAPLKIYRFQDEMFSDVTAQYPELIEKDAAQLLASAKSGREQPQLALAAYLADMTRLGQSGEGVEIFSQICKDFVKPAVQANDWQCEKWLEQVQEAIANNGYNR